MLAKKKPHMLARTAAQFNHLDSLVDGMKRSCKWCFFFCFFFWNGCQKPWLTSLNLILKESGHSFPAVNELERTWLRISKRCTLRSRRFSLTGNKWYLDWSWWQNISCFSHFHFWHFFPILSDQISLTVT